MKNKTYLIIGLFLSLCVLFFGYQFYRYSKNEERSCSTYRDTNIGIRISFNSRADRNRIIDYADSLKLLNEVKEVKITTKDQTKKRLEFANLLKDTGINPFQDEIDISFKNIERVNIDSITTSLRKEADKNNLKIKDIRSDVLMGLQRYLEENCSDNFLNFIYKKYFGNLLTKKTQTPAQQTTATQPVEQPVQTITPISQPTEITTNWKLISGNKDDSCTNPVYEGNVSVKGWYEMAGYLGKEWMLAIADADVNKLPAYFYNEDKTKNVNRFVKLNDATLELEQRLKNASKEKPEIIILRGYNIYCEGSPNVSVGLGSQVFLEDIK